MTLILSWNESLHQTRYETNSGYSDNQTCAGATAPLGAGVPSWTSTTRKVDASFTPTNGTSHSIALAGTSRAGTSGSWDPLTDNTAFTITSVATDGYNTVSASATARTKLLATPSAPSCSLVVTDGEAPGAIKVSGGNLVRLGGATTYASPHTFTGLSAKSYSGSAANVNSDGHNTATSAWAGCGTRAIGEAPPDSLASCTAYWREALPELDRSISGPWDAGVGNTYGKVKVEGGSFTPALGSRPESISYELLAGFIENAREDGLSQYMSLCAYKRTHTFYDKGGFALGLYNVSYGSTRHASWWGVPRAK